MIYLMQSLKKIKTNKQKMISVFQKLCAEFFRGVEWLAAEHKLSPPSGASLEDFYLEFQRLCYFHMVTFLRKHHRALDTDKDGNLSFKEIKVMRARTHGKFMCQHRTHQANKHTQQI